MLKFKFLKETSDISTTRVTFFMAVVASLLLVGVICFNIIYKTWHCEQVSWASLSAFLISISTFNAPFIFGKVQQKKIELENKKLKENPKDTIKDINIDTNINS